MRTLKQDANSFAGQKLAEVADAGQRVALRLLCGIDLSAALGAGQEEKARLAERIERLINRERLKGLRRHWSYDLNRHIALKQALDRIRDTSAPSPAAADMALAKPVCQKTKRRKRAPLDYSRQMETAFHSELHSK